MFALPTRFFALIRASWCPRHTRALGLATRFAALPLTASATQATVPALVFVECRIQCCCGEEDARSIGVASGVDIC
ncbi:hypothetical protein CBOM_08010 [Ceraceosorus bombacis]|uniref:Uncharacterized protein n=1 Tax=Ceraceosorus bombacis TaxID=401625 RepID=A0A0P1BJJ5_9BASI|nr:hypothetical protein CBOM_08010 [Ceraceosorus bombacis]